MEKYFSFPHIVTRRIFAKQVLSSFCRVLCGLDLPTSQPFLGDHLSPAPHRLPELGLRTDGPGALTTVCNILNTPRCSPPTAPNPHAHHHQPPSPHSHHHQHPPCTPPPAPQPPCSPPPVHRSVLLPSAPVTFRSCLSSGTADLLTGSVVLFFPDC